MFEGNPVYIDPEPDLVFGLYDMEQDFLESLVEAQIKNFPELGNVGTRSQICGPESFTPDGKPLFGETPEVIVASPFFF